MLKDDVYNYCRFKNLSINTANAYWGWIRNFIIFNKKRHPSELTSKVNDFLIHLSVVKKLAPKTIRQAGATRTQKNKHHDDLHARNRYREKRN